MAVKAAESEGPTPTAGWSDPGQVEWYLDRIDRLPPRLAGENALVELLPPAPETLLDLGCGDGRLAALVLATRPTIERVVAIDVSEPDAPSRRMELRRRPAGHGAPLGPGRLHRATRELRPHRVRLRHPPPRGRPQAGPLHRDRPAAPARGPLCQLGGRGVGHPGAPRRIPRCHRAERRRPGRSAGGRGDTGRPGWGKPAWKTLAVRGAGGASLLLVGRPAGTRP